MIQTLSLGRRLFLNSSEAKTALNDIVKTPERLALKKLYPLIVLHHFVELYTSEPFWDIAYPWALVSFGLAFSVGLVQPFFFFVANVIHYLPFYLLGSRISLKQLYPLTVLGYIGLYMIMIVMNISTFFTNSVESGLEVFVGLLIFLVLMFFLIRYYVNYFKLDKIMTSLSTAKVMAAWVLTTFIYFGFFYIVGFDVWWLGLI